MTKFFLTLDAHGIPLPIYEQINDINVDYKNIFDMIQKVANDK